MELASHSVLDLLNTYGAVMEELRRRKVVRSANNPVSDLAEHLFCTAYPGWTREGNSASGHDAKDPAGVRYQVKARRLTPHNGSRQLSAIRKLPGDPFEFLAGVLFDAHFGILRAAIIPLAVVKERAVYVDHTKSWKFMLRDDVWAVPGVEDVTAKIRQAAASL